MGIATSYAQCPGNGGASFSGVFDDMFPETPATDSTVVKGYFCVNWYPTPDSVINIDSINDPNWASYQIYQLSRINTGTTNAPDWKMQVTATKADSLFATFGIGFPTSGIDLSSAAGMSIDVDNSAQPTTPLFFSANLTDINGVQLQYMQDTTTGYQYYYDNYDNWYKRKFTDTLNATPTTVNTSYHTTGHTEWPGLGQSQYSTSVDVTTVTFDFAGGFSIVPGPSDTLPAADNPSSIENFPCSSSPYVGGNSKNFVFYCPAVTNTQFDWHHVVSIAFYFNGGGVLQDSATSTKPAPNPDPKFVSTTGVSYPVFKGTVILDNFSIGTNSGCCFNYLGCEPVGPAAVTAATPFPATVNVYPNPVSASSGSVTINDNSAPSYTITVTNSVGATVSTNTGTTFNSPASPGMYFVTYTSTGGTPRTLPLIVK